MKYATRIATSVLLACFVLLPINAAVADEHSTMLSESALIAKKMDDFHDAADQGDKARYLNHFSKDAVFMGTDDWERWPFKTFSEYVNTRFKDGKGWSYKPLKRFTNFSAQHDFAWVDEILESEKWGRFRGTAVLAKTTQGWKLKHYSMSVLVPNESWVDVSNIVRPTFDQRSVEAGVEPPVATEPPSSE